MNIWFCSDFHFGHGNIIRYCKRPFLQEGDLTKEGQWISKEIELLRTEEHDNTLIKRFNDRVEENDLVFFLGDFCMKFSSEASNAPKNAFEYYRNQLKCKNIVFINGKTHDPHNGVKTPIESIIINYGGKRIYLTHNPKFAQEEFYWNFTGHCHGNEGIFRKLGKKSYIVDLSVDCWNFYPVNINEINQAFSEWLKHGKTK